MSWIRSWGLGVFVALIAVWLLFVWLLLDWLVERAIEETGTEIVGARVELDAAEVGFAPLSITLHRLQVTDPDEPMRNAFELRRLHADLVATALLQRRVDVHELSADGLRFGTARERSGALERRWLRAAGEASKDVVESLVGEFELPALEVPDPAALLADEQLESLRIIESAQSEISEMESRWRQRLKELPDEARFEEYRRRFEALKRSAGGGSLGALGAAGDIAILKGEIEADLARLQQAADELPKDLARMRELSERAAKAPAQDLERLRERYGLSMQGLANLGGRLLGPMVATRLEQWLGWWQRVEPFVARAAAATAGESGPEVVEPLRGAGVDVRFPERSPTPDLLIRRVRVGVEIEAGAFEGEITDITPDQPAWGRPLRAHFEAGELAGLVGVELDAVLDHVKPDAWNENLTLRLKGYRLAEMALSSHPDWALRLEEGLLDFDLDATRGVDGIDARARANLSQARLAPQFADSGVVASALADTLAGVRALRLEADVRGRLDAPELALRSPDLDRLLAQATGSLVRSQLARVNAQLEEAVRGQTAGPLAALGQDRLGMQGIQSELAGRMDLGEQVLGSGSGLPVPGFKLPF